MDYDLTEKNNELRTDLIQVKNVLNEYKSKMSFSTNDDLLENIDSVIEQIDNKTFTVSVIATIKAGKSTFLNALLGNEYLPSSNVPETSNLLFIRNSEEILLQKNKEVIKGITNIKNEIAERNKNDRENGVNTLNKYTLFVPYKKLDSLKNLNFQFVDTPGPNESGVPTLKNEVEKILKVSDVIIYLMDYGKLNSTDENELFSTISTIRKDLLSDIKSKVFFVVNKMDSKNTNSLNEEETINFVKEQLKKQLKIDSPNIYCISAENALLAKMIKVQNYKRIDDIGRKAFGDFGWNDDDKEDIKISKLTDTILEKFIEKSGVPRLEDKIISFIVSNSESLFYESIVSKVVNIIQEVKNVFFTKKKLMEKDEENLKNLESELSSKIDEIKKQLKDIDSIIKKVAQDIGKDIDNSFDNFEKTITEFIKQFVTSKEKTGKYNGIASDIEDFIDTGADFAIEKLAPGKNDKEKNKNKKVYRMIYKFGKATLKVAHDIIVNWNSSDVNKSEEKAKELNSYLIQYVETGFASIKEDLEIEAKNKLNSVNFDIKKIINEANSELFSTVNSKLQLDENLKPIDIEIPLNDSFQINADYTAYIDKQQGKGGFCKPNYTVSVELNPDKIISFWTKEISRQKIISKKAVNEYIQVAIKEKIEETKKEFQKNAATFISLIQEQLRDCKNRKETSADNSEIIKNTISKIKEIENKVKLENSIQFWQKNKIVVKNFNNRETGKTEMALLAFDGKMRDKIIAKFNEQFLIEGDHIKNGGVSSPKTMLSLIGGGAGSVGLAGVTSGQLFMATANPATLMQIGNGVGSAVMGSSGIVAQAPFLPVAGALMPVVAPLIAFQALSTITIMKQFEVVNEKLDKIQDTLNTILQRDEATFVGEVISASNRIADIEKQFSVCNQFTDDMIIRLALLEDKINPIFERYNYLYKNQSINSDMSLKDLKLKQTDAFMAIITSILDIRIDLLKMKLNIQNNPGYMESAAHAFVEKIDFYHGLWEGIQKNSAEIDVVANELKEAVSEMNWWQRNMPSWLFGKRKQRKEFENKSETFEKEALKHQIQFNNQVESAIELGDTVKKGLIPDNKMSLIYWRDELGEHSYYTDDLLIENVVNKW